MRAFVVNLSPIGISVFVLAVLLIFVFGLSYGFAYVIKGIEPFLLALIAFSIILFLICVLPCSIVKKLRRQMSVYARFLSLACGGCLWLISFMYILFYLKGWVLLFMWLFPLSTPLAIILLLLDAQYIPAVFLVLAFGATYGMRLYGAWLSVHSEESHNNVSGPTPGEGDVFDAEVVDR